MELIPLSLISTTVTSNALPAPEAVETPAPVEARSVATDGFIRSENAVGTPAASRVAKRAYYSPAQTAASIAHYALRVGAGAVLGFVFLYPAARDFIHTRIQPERSSYPVKASSVTPKATAVPVTREPSETVQKLQARVEKLKARVIDNLQAAKLAPPVDLKALDAAVKYLVDTGPYNSGDSAYPIAARSPRATKLAEVQQQVTHAERAVAAWAGAPLPAEKPGVAESLSTNRQRINWLVSCRESAAYHTPGSEKGDLFAEIDTLQKELAAFESQGDSVAKSPSFIALDRRIDVAYASALEWSQFARSTPSITSQIEDARKVDLPLTEAESKLFAGALAEIEAAMAAHKLGSSAYAGHLENAHLMLHNISMFESSPRFDPYGWRSLELRARGRSDEMASALASAAALLAFFSIGYISRKAFSPPSETEPAR